jgi:hypothetical protein
MIKIIKFATLSILLTFLIFSCSSQKVTSDSHINKTDTIEGFFLYEVNTPRKCYTRFDQIEQGNNLIYFDSIALNKNIEEAYTNGLFYFLYQSVINNYIKKIGHGINQDKNSVYRFTLAIDYLIHDRDSVYNKTLYFDNSRILTYKKVYAKFVALNIGYLDQLVPVTKNYECCYSNKKKSLNTYFITKVISFKLY